MPGETPMDPNLVQNQSEEADSSWQRYVSMICGKVNLLVPY